VSLFVVRPESEDRDKVEVDNWATNILKTAYFDAAIFCHFLINNFSPRMH
jgi:hypothetical protein